MLESISICNFQRHESLDIDFDPSQTTLVGKTGSGKSSVIRAVKWLATNRPRGTSFIRCQRRENKVETAAFAEVVLHFDGRVVSRKAGDGINSYVLDGKEYVAFGADVPEEIAKYLNICPESFQSQHDGCWLFDRSPGDVGKFLNKVVALDLIDRTLGNLAAGLRKAKASVVFSRERLVDAKTRRDSLRWANEANIDLKAVEDKEVEAITLQAKAGRLEGLLAGIDEADKDANNLVPTSELDELENLLVRATVAKQRAVKLEKILADLAAAEDAASDLRAEAESTRTELNERFNGVCPICGGKIK